MRREEGEPAFTNHERVSECAHTNGREGTFTGKKMRVQEERVGGGTQLWERLAGLIMMTEAKERNENICSCPTSILPIRF